MSRYKFLVGTPPEELHYDVDIGDDEKLDAVLADVLAELQERGYSLGSPKHVQIAVQRGDRSYALDLSRTLPAQGVLTADLLRVWESIPGDISTHDDPVCRIPLPSEFRFVHEPLGTAADPKWDRFVGREGELNELVSRITLADGGAFLIAGYRGVGKTTFVNRVVSEVKLRGVLSPEPEQVVDVYLSFARAVEPLALLFHILRSLYRRLASLHLLDKLDRRIRDELELAFLRTSQTISGSGGSENDLGIEVGLKDPHSRSFLVSSLKASRRSMLSRAYSYLAYDDKAAEHDLLDIAQLLVGHPVNMTSGWRRFIPAAIRPRTILRLRIIFIFDELDKLEQITKPGDVGSIDNILNTLKTLFTTSGLYFLFVGGKDLHERWIDDLGRGDSVYESIFTYAHYLPGLWSEAGAVCDSMVGEVGVNTILATDSELYTAFKLYLAFRGRGIPRRIMRAFNEQVRWDNGRAFLSFNRKDVRRIRFYAGLHEVVTNDVNLFRDLGEGKGFESADKGKLGVHYLVDWILLQGSQPFGAESVIAASQQLSRLIAPLSQAAPTIVESLLALLVRNAYLEIVKDSDSRVIGVPRAEERILYRVPRRRLYEMGRVHSVFDQEAYALFDSTRKLPPRDSESVYRRRVRANEPIEITSALLDRYKVIERIGTGGMSVVYLALDEKLGRRVAVKQLRADLRSNDELTERARREARLLATLNHSNIVKVFDIDVNASEITIVMEYLEGMSLRTMITDGRVTNPSLALTIIYDVCSAVQCLHDHDIVWRDPKPSNVIVTLTGRVVMFDLSISRSSGESTVTLPGFVIGTPLYMSPEQFMGRSIDNRSDIFGLGSLFYELITGRHAFAAVGIEAVMRLVIDGEVVWPADSIDVGSEVRAAIMRCLEKDPARRFQSISEFMALLPPRSALPNAPLMHKLLGQTRTNVEAAQADTAIVPPPVHGLTAFFRTEVDEPSMFADSWLTKDGKVIHVLRQQETTIGRDAMNDVRISMNGVSRYHARILLQDDGFWIEDLNSVNGTFVNAERIQVPRRLSSDDAIQVGAERIVYQTRIQAEARADRLHTKTF